MKKLLSAASAFGMTLALAGCGGSNTETQQDSLNTATPIKHLVVIFQENVSFDHYYGTYPTATNPAGEPSFTAAAGTPSVNGFTTALLTSNPNLNVANGTGATNPFRLDRTQAATSDQGHSDTPEQQAEDNGLGDLFPKFTGKAGTGGSGAFNTTGLVMGYYDGNTVTALWNYAQGFAMSDNAYSDQYGPSSPGAINLISGQTNGFTSVKSSFTGYFISDGQGGHTMIGDVDPAGDSCSSSTDQASMGGKNIGNLLNGSGVTWGWFQGGFNTGLTNGNATTGCSRSTVGVASPAGVKDYSPHHEPFQYYASTANLTHARPNATSNIGFQGDGANHQYDIQDFFTAVASGNFPSVSFLKASEYQDGHPGYSDPLDEQTFITETINFLEQTPDWNTTAVVILYDDSDGWYDHAYHAPTNGSFDPTADQVNGAGSCGTNGVTPVANGLGGKPVNGRCGPGVRQPFLVISPWSKQNYVSHVLITQASVTRFIEDNWLGGERLGGGSFDASVNSITDLFNFSGAGNNPLLFLDNKLGTQVATPATATPK